MDEVAAAVGVTKPLLYNYFGNKEQLFLACMKPAADALRGAVVVGAVAAAPDAPERAARRHPRVLRVPGRRRRGVAGAARRDAARRRRDRRARGEYRARMEALVTAALQERTESRAVEPLSVAIFGAAEALGPLVAAHRRDAQRRAHRRAVDSHASNPD